ncbi:pleiotropic drug resistance protein 3 isoform X1 [Spinacia oleracea]|uniref:Pleiotropic drug resistance protein 3 isoform X1 n=2 Tax=Spinacia oleracea TaxID=3562 RepID=A0A9R0IYQ6_SPIOL|nr:pleiotropic drug resistance protein 3-like isoform X1 [Spinacia oleracea]XP_021858037.2 pleiotropic drug resistance protein 3-like isoform X1 [Spinacia oleracea]
MDKVGLQFPAVKVKYKNLFLEAKCKVVDGKPLPTLWNSFKSSVPVFSKLLGSQLQEAKLSIIKDVSGLIKPGRMTLLLGPPGCWKTSLLLALSGNLDRNNEKIVQKLSIPSTGSKDHFRSCFSLSGWEQYKSCLWKQQLSYWRSPSYNLTRLMFAFMSSLIFGLLFWQQGKNINDEQSMFTIFGSMFSAVMFLGINICSPVIPFIATEKTVIYRERFAGMYSSWAYSFAQVTVELPYLLTVAFIFTVITYPMIGYYLSAYKVFWYFYAMSCTLMYFNYMGMMLVSLTPNTQVAAITASATYTLMNLFSGFLIPQPRIPKWWLWLFYLCPTSWTLHGLLSSQYGDIHEEITAFGKTNTVASFIEDYSGCHHDRLGLVAAMLIIFPLTFASLFAYFIGKLNFQRR